MRWRRNIGTGHHFAVASPPGDANSPVLLPLRRKIHFSSGKRHALIDTSAHRLPVPAGNRQLRECPAPWRSSVRTPAGPVTSRTRAASPPRSAHFLEAADVSRALSGSGRPDRERHTGVGNGESGRRSPPTTFITELVRFEHETMPFLDRLYVAATQMTCDRADTDNLVQQTYLRPSTRSDRSPRGPASRFGCFGSWPTPRSAPVASGSARRALTFRQDEPAADCGENNTRGSLFPRRLERRPWTGYPTVM